jgi:hypothetical protein
MTATYYCAYCGKPIPPEVIAARHYPKDYTPLMCCNRTHDALRRARDGEYKRMSEKGREGRRAFLAKARPRRKPSAETNAKISATMKRRAKEKQER